MINNAISTHVLPPPEGGLSLLEHLHAGASKKCIRKGFSAPTMLAIDRKKKLAIYTEVNCKQWDCPACGYRNAMRWIARIIEGIKHYGGQWYFMTLTAHAEMRGAEKSLLNLREGWRKVYNRLLRRVGAFHYVKIFEHHKDGSLHLHLLADLELPYTKRKVKSKKTGKIIDEYRCKVLKDMSAQCGMGFKADYQPLENPGLAAWYIAKYISKSIGVDDYPRNLRRIQCSHGWLVLPSLLSDQNIEWRFIPDRSKMLWDAYILLIKHDIVTFDAITEKDVTSDDWEKILYEV